MSDWADLGIQIPDGATGPEVSTTCPSCSHDRKKKSAKPLRVNIQSGAFLCHHCGFKGANGHDRPQGANGTERRQGPRRFKLPPPSIETPLAPRVLEWLLARNLTQAVIRRNRLESRGADTVVYPYFRDGQLVNRKYRSIAEKKFWMEQDAERVLWGLDDLTGHEVCLLVEGEGDKLALEVAGFLNVVSVPSGAPAVGSKDMQGHLSYLATAEPWLRGMKEIALAGDADPPGIFLRDELARRVGRERCSVVNWPEGCKDAGDVLMLHGPDVLRGCVEARRPYPIRGIVSVTDQADEIDFIYDHGLQPGVSTGWHTLDEFYTCRAGELTIITGIPGSGKSAWLDAMLVNLSRLHNWNIAMFSAENQPVADHMARMVEKYLEIPFRDGLRPRMTHEQLDDGRGWVNDHFSWIMPNEASEWDLDNILNFAKILLFRKDIRGLVIDPWNEMEHLRPQGMTEAEYVNYALKKLRQFARLNEIHVWLVAHPAKLYRMKDGTYPVPTLYDCSGGAAFRNKADNGIVVWRDLVDPGIREVCIYVQKIRFRQVGRIGMAKLRYVASTANYKDLNEPKLAGPVPTDWVGRSYD